MATESDLERQCRRHAQSLGGYLLKIRTPGTRGFHDRLLLLRGYTCFIEFKHPSGSGRKSAPQASWQKRLEALSIPACEINSYDDFITLCHKRGTPRQ